MKYQSLLGNGNCIDLDICTEQHEKGVEKLFSFKLVLNGTQHFKIGSRKLILYPDCFMVIGPGISYESIIDSDTCVQALSISITDKFINEYHYGEEEVAEKRAISLISSSYTAHPMIYTLRGDMLYNFKNIIRRVINKEEDEELLNIYLHHCLLNYHKLYDEELSLKLAKLKFVRSSTKSEIIKRLALAKEFISTNYNKRFSLEDLAMFSCLSVNHLLRTFKQAYGMSPYQYLSLVRLNRARIYLQGGEYSVNQIVMLVGFESVSSFIRLFKSTFNSTPLKFKKQYGLSSYQTERFRVSQEVEMV